MNAPVAHDWSPRDVRRFLLLLHEPGAFFEIRIPRHGQYKSTASGYFDNVDVAVEAIQHWDGRANTYVTLNPCDPPLLARASNRIIDRADTTTSDSEIVRRHWLFIDIDPIRASGISATDEEVAAARAVADDVAAFLTAARWPGPIDAFSGNGYYLLYQIDLPNDAETTALIQRCLAALSERFSTAAAHIDGSVFNAARIIGVVGTMKTKGDPLPDRPHRRSCIVQAPDEVECVTRKQIEALAGGLERTPAPRVHAGRAEALTAILDRYGIAYRSQPPDANDIVWEHVERCPFHEDGRAFECGVGQSLRDGHYAAHCFHPEGAAKTWHDWKAALGLSTDKRADDPDMASAEKPQIVITERHLHEISDDGWRTLQSSERPLYRHGRVVADVIRDDDGRPRIAHLGVAALRGKVDRAATWLRADKNGLHPVAPPKAVVEDMLALPDDLPSLKGIVGTPTFAADGSLNTRPGYQLATKLFYEPSGEPLPPVPKRPDASDLRKAKLIFQELLGDFPFAENASMAHAIAVPITAAAREMIDGPTPLFAFDAPAPGTGKTILGGCLGLIVSGAPPALTTNTKSEDEMRKRITALVIAAAPIVLLDNVKRRLTSETLAGVLTTTTWADRVLGKSEYVDLPIRTIWLVTGNNLELDTDIARRTVWIRLDAKVDMPWERTGFRNPLPEWAVRHRHELVWATLVLVRHWIASGRPEWTGQLLGSFEAWSRVVGGILACAGIDGFLENREQLYRRMDSETEHWRAFTRAWWDEYGDQPVKVADLYPLADEIIPGLFTGNDEPTERTLRSRLGWALVKRRDRRIGDLTIRKDDDDAHNKVNTWRLEHAGGSVEATDLPADSPQENRPISDSFAGDAGSCGSVFVVGAIAGGSSNEVRAMQEVRNPHPQPPHSPQPDSKSASNGAGSLREVGLPTSKPPQDYRCSRCRMPMNSARVSDVCGWCQKAAP